jgi:hypothetical protein
MSHVRPCCATDHPIAAFLHSHQQRFTVYFWAGIVHDVLIGPYLLPSRLSAQIYRVFLEETLPELLEEIPLVTQEKHVAQPRRGCGSFRTSGPRISHRNLQRSLDWTRQDCSLASQVTEPHVIGHLPMGLHENLDLLTAS